MKTFPTLFLFLVVCTLSACQKEVSWEIPSTPGTGNGNGNGNNSSSSYGPISTGTWHKYKDSTSGSFTTQTFISKTKSMNGVVYTALDPAGNADTVWMASPSPNYYMAAKGNSPNTGAPYDFLFHYLNDTASVGYSWEYIAGHGNGFTAHMKTTIKEKNISMTVAGKTYNNVIHTEQELIYDLMGTLVSFGTYDYFVAKGVGIIKIRSSLNAFGVTLSTCSDLVDYQIK